MSFVYLVYDRRPRHLLYLHQHRPHQGRPVDLRDHVGLVDQVNLREEWGQYREYIIPPQTYVLQFGLGCVQPAEPREPEEQDLFICND